jgi:NADPH:quinone reductase-like Zn-dependent oxidoreductase
MRLRAKSGAALALVLVLGLLALAFTVAHDSAPAPAQALPAAAVPMKAVVHRQYGSPDVVKLEQLARPTPKDDELLIRVRAAAINPLDWHYMRGTPYVVRLIAGLGRPRPNRIQLGVDFAGTVEAVGKKVTQFKVGDDLFGTAYGSLAEYTVSTEVGLALKPSNMTFEQAAAVPVAALTALQGLREIGELQPGQKVLINGASGGVGTFAVQLAKYLGAKVTGVCSTRNLELVRSIGADHVIDYTHSDYTQGAERYDLIFDTVGNHGLLASVRALTPQGTLVIAGTQSNDPWLGGLARPLRARLIAPFVKQRLVTFLADANKTTDVDLLRDLLQDGKLKPVIDREYSLSQAPEAIRYLEAGHARGKVVIRID